MIIAKDFLLEQNFGDNKLTKKEEDVYFDSVIGHNAYIKGMIDFAKMHVKEALKSASENLIIEGHSFEYELDKSSVLNSYNLDNIK